jgi:hypothetical protein
MAIDENTNLDEIPEDVEEAAPEEEQVEEVEQEEEAPEADEEEEVAPVEAQGAKQGAAQQGESRAQKRIRAQQEENNRLREEAAAAKAQADLLRLQFEQSQRVQQQAAHQRELEALPEDERWRRESNGILLSVQHQVADSNDRNSYTLAAMANPLMAEMAGAVEAELLKARQAGFNPSRQNCLLKLLGERALKGAAAAPAKKAAGKAKVAAARGVTPGLKSQVASGGKAAPSLAERLVGVRL